jgi:hypothetical protein
VSGFRRKEKEFPGAEQRTAALQFSGETTGDSEGSERRKFARGMDLPPIDGKQIVRDKGFIVHGDGRWAAIVQINAAQSLGNVQLAGPSCFIDPVPIEYSIGGIAILLDFHDHVSSADGVHSAARNEESVARFDLEPLNKLRGLA